MNKIYGCRALRKAVLIAAIPASCLLTCKSRCITEPPQQAIVEHIRKRVAPEPKTIHMDDECSVVIYFHQETYKSIKAEGHEKKMTELVDMITKSMPLIMKIAREREYALREGELRIKISNERKTDADDDHKGLYDSDNHTIYIGKYMWGSWRDPDFDKLLRFVVFLHEFGHSLGTRNGIYSWFKGDYGEDEYADARASYNDIVGFLQAKNGKATRQDVGRYLRELSEVPKRYTDMVWHFTMLPRAPRGLDLEALEEGIDNLMARFIALDLAKVNPDMTVEKLREIFPLLYPEMTAYAYLISKLVGTDKFLTAHTSGDFSMVKEDFLKSGVFRDEMDFITGIQNPHATIHKIREVYGDGKVNEWLGHFSPVIQESFRKKAGWQAVR